LKGFFNGSFHSQPQLLDFNMIKLLIGFIILAGAALYLMSKGGNIDMGGEKHGIEADHPAAAASAPAAAASEAKR
jgi:hypothetical protein